MDPSQQADGSAASVDPALHAGSPSDPSHLLLDAIMAKLDTLDKLSSECWDYMREQNASLLTQLHTIDIKMSTHRAATTKNIAAAGTVETQVTTAASVASDALSVATTARDDIQSLHDSLPDILTRCLGDALRALRIDAQPTTPTNPSMAHPSPHHMPPSSDSSTLSDPSATATPRVGQSSPDRQQYTNVRAHLRRARDPYDSDAVYAASHPDTAYPSEHGPSPTRPHHPWHSTSS